MNTKLLALYGLKFHPFHADVPIEALYATPAVCARAGRVMGLCAESLMGIALAERRDRQDGHRDDATVTPGVDGPRRTVFRRSRYDGLHGPPQRRPPRWASRRRCW